MRALVCGAGGFIGGYLTYRLREKGYWVRGVDVKQHEFRSTATNEFMLLDLREKEDCQEALSGGFDEVYQLAAQMGGMGYIETAECDILHDSALINIHMIHEAAAAGVKRFFFSSSVCVYRNMQEGESPLLEEMVYPANPHNEYGWEKLFAERVLLAYGRHNPMKIRIARFQNCYGPYGTWQGGREKAPAAICRKVVLANPSIEVWGDGSATRSYTYIDDMIDGIIVLMQSNICHPVTIGSSEVTTVDQLVNTVAAVAGKVVLKRYVRRPVGVQHRNFSKVRIHSLNWRCMTPLLKGISMTYPWIKEQVDEQLAG